MKIILHVMLLLYACTASADEGLVITKEDIKVVEEALLITNQEEIDHAIQIRSLSGELFEKTYLCRVKQNGEMKGCSCRTRDECPFKIEYDRLTEALCTATKLYPEWKYSNVRYDYINPNPKAVLKVMQTLVGTKFLYEAFGKSCK